MTCRRFWRRSTESPFWISFSAIFTRAAIRTVVLAVGYMADKIIEHFDVGGHEGYITVGLYDDGTPGKIFLTMAKEGSTISGLMDAFATAISLTLQYGVPLEALVEKFSHMRFEPAGYTKNPEIPIAKSLVDYIFRYLASRFLTADLRARAGVISREENGNGNGGLAAPSSRRRAPWSRAPRPSRSRTAPTPRAATSAGTSW